MTEMSVVFASTHFRWAEFDSHDGTPLPVAMKPSIRHLCLGVLEPLREAWRHPIMIVSGWRSPAWNARVGGADKSQHVEGTAADIRPLDLGGLPYFRKLIRDMVRAGKLADLGGYGVYTGWVHVDVRPRKPNGALYVWRGRGMGSEPAM